MPVRQSGFRRVPFDDDGGLAQRGGVPAGGGRAVQPAAVAPVAPPAAPGVRPLQGAPEGQLGGRAGAIEHRPGHQAAQPLIHPQHQRERTQSPARGGLAQQAVLPLPPVGQQSGLHFAGDLPGQKPPLLVDGGERFPHARHRFVEPGAAGVQRVGHQLQEVRPADAVGRRAGHLPGEQVQQIGHLPPRLQAGLGVARARGASRCGRCGRLVVPSPFGRGLG